MTAASSAPSRQGRRRRARVHAGGEGTAARPPRPRRRGPRRRRATATGRPHAATSSRTRPTRAGGDVPARRGRTRRAARPRRGRGAGRPSDSQRRSASASASGVAGRHEEARAGCRRQRSQRLGDAADVGGDHRQAPRERLGDDHPVGLRPARHDEHVRRGVRRVQRAAGPRADEQEPVVEPEPAPRPPQPGHEARGHRVSGPTQVQRQGRSATRRQGGQQQVLALAGRHRPDAEQPTPPACRVRRRSAGGVRRRPPGAPRGPAPGPAPYASSSQSRHQRARGDDRRRAAAHHRAARRRPPTGRCISSTRRSRRRGRHDHLREAESEQPVHHDERAVRAAPPGRRPAASRPISADHGQPPGTSTTRTVRPASAERLAQPPVVGVAPARAQRVVDPLRHQRRGRTAASQRTLEARPRDVGLVQRHRDAGDVRRRHRARRRGRARPAGPRRAGPAPRWSCWCPRTPARRRGCGRSARPRPRAAPRRPRPMSTRIPSSSSASPRNVASTTKVAPCSRWAGPKTSPRRLCATIMWSRTVTPNTAPPRRRRSPRGTAPAARARRGAASPRATSSKGDSPVSRQSNASSRSSSSASASRSAVVRRSAPGRRHRADLAGPQAQPAGVEAAAERERRRPVAVPAELDDRALRRQQLEGALQAGGRGAGVERPGRTRRPAVVGRGEVHPERGRRRGAGRVDVDERHRDARDPRQQPGDAAAEQAGADHGHPVAEQRRGVPQGVDAPSPRCRPAPPAPPGTSSGTTVTAEAGTTYAVWWGCRQKTVRPRRSAGPVLDEADAEVAVLDRAGEVAVLERRPHRVVLARRHVPAEDQGLGPPADRGPQRPHEHVLRARRRQRDRDGSRRRPARAARTPAPAPACAASSAAPREPGPVPPVPPREAPVSA